MARTPLVFERLLPAPPDVVFQHWSDPESLALWTGRGIDEIPFREMMAAARGRLSETT